MARPLISCLPLRGVGSFGFPLETLPHPVWPQWTLGDGTQPHLLRLVAATVQTLGTNGLHRGQHLLGYPTFHKNPPPSSRFLHGLRTHGIRGSHTAPTLKNVGLGTRFSYPSPSFLPFGGRREEGREEASALAIASNLAGSRSGYRTCFLTPISPKLFRRWVVE